MNDTVIRVENLGKRYELGVTHHDHLADQEPTFRRLTLCSLLFGLGPMLFEGALL